MREVKHSSEPAAPEHETPSLSLGCSTMDDPAALMQKEWLVTNGTGGYASNSLLGVATRRYHGLFVPDLPSKGRMVIVPRMDDVVETERGSYCLSGVEYADGRLEGEASRYIQAFRLEWQMPVWTFELDGVSVEKRVVMPYGQNTVYIHFTLLHGSSIRLRLRPFVTCRMHDAPLSRTLFNPNACVLTLAKGQHELSLQAGMPALKLCLRPQAGSFTAEERIDRSVSYRVDRERGSEHVEDLFSPGYFIADLAAGESVAIVASVESWDLLEFDTATILEAERRRLEKLAALVPGMDEFALQLAMAADQFIVSPGSRPEEQVLARAAGEEARTVMAGYHWFGDWGRDTMIGLEGLTLCTGRYREAGAILRTFAHYIRDGLIPNLFPEGERTALFHTADATLWYFHALDRYVNAADDRDTLRALFPLLKDVLRHHREGTRFGIGVDPKDGLLRAGAPGFQLTWMDAKVEDWVVTPRRGKPVEIQALWYNALRLMGDWADRLGEPSDDWLKAAEEVEDSFHARYWYEAGQYLFDVVDGEEGDDASLRPNQIFSLSFRFPILREERWQPVVDVVTDKLLTPVGLRTLAPGHRDYKPTYSGDLRARDAAYHQGTVWAWLIGHYVDARLKVYPDKAAAHRLLAAFHTHIREAGIGTISEIFDAEPPYSPRGCIAQAWSVAEVLRAHLNTRDE
jgi:predicted glycogen debranching enzyme